MTMRLLRYHDLPVTPWKNGGGVTREVISLADSGEGGDFLWRVSIANISASGPFSRFDNIDRTIAVLAGNGIRLSHPNGSVDLTATAKPYPFAGETAIYADVIDGETTDLNAMSRRHRFTHSMQAHMAALEATIRTTAAHSILVFGGPMTIVYEAERTTVTAFDALADIPPGSVVRLIAPEPTRYHLITFQPAT